MPAQFADEKLYATANPKARMTFGARAGKSDRPPSRKSGLLSSRPLLLLTQENELEVISVRNLSGEVIKETLAPAIVPFLPQRLRNSLRNFNLFCNRLP